MQLSVHDVRIFENVPFDTYLTFPGLSFSAAKGSGPINPTEGMRLGSLVHQYLLEPTKYDGTNYKLVRAIAGPVAKKIGPALLKTAKTELTVMCTLVHAGYYLFYKGRVDMWAGGMVIDLKVSKLDVVKAIQHFGYNNQLNGYSLPLNAIASLLVAVHPETFAVSMAPVPNATEWWSKAVLRHGTKM